MQIHYAHPANDVHQRRIWMIPHKKGRLLATYHARCKPRERCGQFRQWWCQGGRHGQQGQALHDRAGTKLRSQLVTKLQANFQPLNHCQPLFLEVNICQRNDNASNIDTDIYTLHIIQIFISLNFLQTLFRYLIIIFMMHKNHLNLNLNFEFIFEFLVFLRIWSNTTNCTPYKGRNYTWKLETFYVRKRARDNLWTGFGLHFN